MDEEKQFAVVDKPSIMPPPPLEKRAGLRKRDENHLSSTEL